MKGISFLIIFLVVSCSSHRPAADPVQDPLLARYESYRQCYLESENYRGRHSDPKGHMVVEFLINNEGKVKNEKIVENTFQKDPNFNACVLHQIRLINFPDVKTETTVRQHINFFPKA